MTRDQYQRAGDLFDRLRVLPAHEQDLALDEACGSNAELRAQVVRLLRADRAAAGEEFLARPVMEEAAGMIEMPLAGTVVGKYRLGRRIGAGGMGVVYDAEDLTLQRRVAVKILPVLHSAEAEERIQRFQREARATAQLNHPHIAAIYDAGLDQGCHYIAMELVEGHTLREMIAREPLESARILDVLGQVASALSAAHAAGIIHRDMKPENIMVRPDGFVKVLDFGLASMRETAGEPSLRTRPGQMTGTVHYFSPEQVLGKPAMPQSDLFSLGVVAYEMATGRRPFQGAADGAVFEAILHAEAPAPSEIRPALGREFDDLVKHALEKDPELRYQTASDFRSSCLRLSRHSGTWQQVAPPAGRKTRRNWLRWGALAGAAVLVVVAAWWALHTPAAPRVTQIVQITRSEAPVSYFVSDGVRIYFAAGAQEANMRMFQVGAEGGEPLPMRQLDGMFPLDISPDHAQILLAQANGQTRYGPFPLWVTAAMGSAPRRLGELAGKFARWSPKGDRIAYSDEGSLRIAAADGVDGSELAHVNGYIEDGTWSPDGQRLRFSVSQPNSRRIWEVRADGSGLHAVSFPGWNEPWFEMGAWTADGKDFLFSAGQASHDLWMSRQGGSPFRLTNGPLWDLRPQPAGDGQRVFFQGTSNIGQLIRLDTAAKEWTPFLNGMDAAQVAYSRDGKWIAYADSKGRLWRSAADGSERRQLTGPPQFARNPRWSPDGRNIVFHAGAAGQPDAIYVAAATGASVTRLTQGERGSEEGDGNWSPDGSVVLYSARKYLYTVTVRTRHIEQLPNTAGLWSPRWSPDGKYVAALDQNAHLRLYDMATKRAEEEALTSFPVGYPMWSRDGRYVYFENNSSTAWYRVGVAGRRVELVQRLPGLETALNSLGWVGMTPDGMLISARTVNSSNLYALEWGQ